MYTFNVLIFLSVISCYVSGDSTTDFPEKSILRYGFQNTQECQDYEKAYICVQKCQDLNYDTAVSDKHCKCTCYMNPELQKHKIKYNTTRNNWKSGAPTTKLPIWAQTTNTDKNNIIDDDDDDHTTDDVNKGSTPNDNDSSDTHSAEDANTTEGQDGTTTDGSGPTQDSSDDASNSTDANNTSNAADTETANDNGTVDGDTNDAPKPAEESDTTTTETPP